MLTHTSVSSRQRRSWFLATLFCVQVSGCATRGPQPPSPPPHAGATAPLAVPAGSVRYVVDPDRTELTIIVRRAGPLARLGHDHVVTSQDETGSAWLTARPETSAFELRVPVAEFEVDLPEARSKAGPEFAQAVPESARAGTRANMLRPEVLDAGQYPTIALRSTTSSGEWPDVKSRVAVEFKGSVTEFEVPMHVQQEGGVLQARGSLQVSQSQLGLTPFSVAGGAIQVGDMLEIRFELVATTEPRP